jgi:hypothetical protein
MARDRRRSRPSFLLSDAMGHVVDPSSLRREDAACFKHTTRTKMLG